MQAYFERLGAHLEKAWSAIGRDEDGFSDIAVSALERLPPNGNLDTDALIDAVLNPAVPRQAQLAPPGVFGQPGVTVHHGNGFVIDVYFWLQSSSAIHDHPFCGAFTVLQGFSVHAVYRFEARENLGARARLGDIRLDRLERLEAGDVGAFSRSRHALIHALLHVPVPSVSMVVRTVRTEGYMRYFPPAVAIAMDSPAEAFERPMMLLDTLRSAGDSSYERRFAAFLRKADFETTFRSLSRVWYGLQDDERAHWLAVARPQLGPRVDAIAPSLDEAYIAHEADVLRQGLADPDDRFVATGLVVADGRNALLGLLAPHHPDPLERLHRLVDESPVFAGAESAPAILAHALIDGQDADGALRRLAGVYGEAALAGRKEEILRYCRGCAFARLGR